jgi:hypothetical protein
MPTTWIRALATFKEKLMSVGTMLLIVLFLMLLGAVPVWPHSRNWGYASMGGIGVVALVVMVLLVMGRS